jgi:hypothetical protein
MCKSLFAILLLSGCLLSAQQALNNDAIVKLVKAGLSDDLILSTINASPGSYDVSASGLIALKSEGASDRIVSAIVLKVSGTTSTPPVAANPIGANPDDPSAPHEAGIYAYCDNAPDRKMVMLEPSVYSQQKLGNLFATGITYGIAKAKMKAVIRGAHSNARVTDPQAIFYFFFEQQGAGLSNASSIFSGTSTPNEYTLLRFDVKKETRETIVGKFSVWGGSGGTDDKAVVPFTYTKLRPGVYKVTLSAQLQPGEYGFVAPGVAPVVTPYRGVPAGGGSSRVFDFGFAAR